MTFDEYQQAAAKTRGEQCDDIYLAGKLVFEAAEAGEPVYKFRYHGKPLDVGEVAEELGDILWYVAVLAQVLGLSLSEIAAGNLLKLSLRHGDSYSSQHYQQPIRTPKGGGRAALENLPTLRKNINDIIDELKPEDFDGEPINWADLAAVDS